MTSKNIYIIHRAMFERNGNQIGFGGIENYIIALARTFQEQNWNCILVQPSKDSFQANVDCLTVVGVRTGLLRGNLKKHALVRWVKQRAEKSNDVIIFATDSYSVGLNGYNAVAIQHGISWDKPRKSRSKPINFIASLVNQIKYFSFIKQYHTLVCVDHNFVNWYRTWADVSINKVHVIYNFYDEKISTDKFNAKWGDSSSEQINLIIARRFVEYRGITFIAPVIQKLLQQHKNLHVTFAGDGPLKANLDNMFSNSDRVVIKQYAAKESFNYHSRHHIAVIPTLGSEGTSLSLIEAMAAGCAVVASNVGGLSNLIIDGFNGHLLIPNQDKFYTTLDMLIKDKTRCKKMALAGLDTVSFPSSKQHWGEQWVKLIRNM
ncbi:glycosyl transferase family 1 [Shewanella sp. c952]|uniref:glycosyltransferase family 4 protein n=1 Tax=Shewanella sp. c952 TaxID=2815913 RepID=UPI001BBF3DC5|nr:glycosyltransferase family 4 protein [Shewanella sp. c952]GIU09350.1 glycosyl transferase family 1 [Shewanella sp. c952]